MTTTAIAELHGVTGPESETARSVARIACGTTDDSWFRASRSSHAEDILTGAILMATSEQDLAYLMWVSDALWATGLSQAQEAA